MKRENGNSSKIDQLNEDLKQRDFQIEALEY